VLRRPLVYYWKDPARYTSGPFSLIWGSRRVVFVIPGRLFNSSTVAIPLTVQATDYSTVAFAGCHLERILQEPYPSDLLDLRQSSCWFSWFQAKLLQLFNRGIPLTVQATDYFKHCKLRCRPLVYYWKGSCKSHTLQTFPRWFEAVVVDLSDFRRNCFNSSTVAIPLHGSSHRLNKNLLK
jgi:hypothetical protein